MASGVNAIQPPPRDEVSVLPVFRAARATVGSSDTSSTSCIRTANGTPPTAVRHRLPVPCPLDPLELADHGLDALVERLVGLGERLDRAGSLLGLRQRRILDVIVDRRDEVPVPVPLPVPVTAPPRGSRGARGGAPRSARWSR